MKLKLLFVLFIILNTTGDLQAQDAKEILQKTYNKCQSIENGYYEMTRYFKLMNSRDTSKSNTTCYFDKLKNDDLNLSAFRYDDGDISIYNGNELVSGRIYDSTAIIFSKSLWPEPLERDARRFSFFTPFTNIKYPTIQHDADFNDKHFFFKLIGEEKIENDFCYHVQVNTFYDNEVSEDMRTIAIKYDYWIKKSEFLPIQYSIIYTTVLQKDTAYQYEKNIVTKYEINNLKDKNLFALKSFPDYYKLKDYVPANAPLLLPKNTVAPNWELLSLQDEKINLKNLKGKLVLLDFFTKSCYPCMLSMPGLQALHEKYKKKGLKIIGINIFDKKEDGIIDFISKHGITYTVLLGGKDVGVNYNVSGIPTVYLIDKNGKIIYSIDGYEKKQELVLEDIIKLNL